MVERKRRDPFGNTFFGDGDDDPFGDFDEEFGRMHEMIEKMLKQSLGSAPSFKEVKSGKPLVYGFSMRVGPDGKPQVEEFGNVRQGKVTKEREPLVDVVDLEKEIRVVAEIPGVSKENIHINTEKKTLSIDVQDPERPFHKIVQLPAEVVEKKSNASYKNGILEVVLEKKRPSKKGNIRVE
ncbi:Hsp20/alpha crystallin family protein [Candidatus Micrarchaeota archaeon]|nr:Hsp20/alpha crystallin family protein [Candidatus Micrarchaeota archaeon]